MDESSRRLLELREANKQCYREYDKLKKIISEYGELINKNTEYNVSEEDESIIIGNEEYDIYYFVNGKFFYDDLGLLKEANEFLNNEISKIKEML